MHRRVLLAAAAAAAAAFIACVHRVPEPPPAPPPPAPPAPTGPVTIDIPHRPGTPVVVLPVDSIGAPLFAGELDRLWRWTARFLATQTEQTLDPVPLEQVSDVARYAEQHRLTPAAEQCGVGPTVAQAAAARWPDALMARTWADCDAGGCALITEVIRPNGANAERLGLWRAEVSPPGLPAQWEEAAQAYQPDLAAIVPQPPPVNPETTSQRPEVELVSVTPAGDWAEAPGADAFAGIAPKLNRCHIKGRVARGDDVLVLAYDAAGQATQCAGASRTPESTDVLQCFCEAALEPKMPAGDATRRLVLRLRDPVDLLAFSQDGAPIAARIENFQSSSPAITEELLWPARPWLSLCYGSTRLREPVAFPVTFSIDPTGHITTEDVQGIAAAHALGPCVEGYLRFMLFPCTSSGATVAFTVRISRQDDQNLPTSAAPVPVGTRRTEGRWASGAAPSTRGWSSSGMPTPNALPISVPVSTSVR